MASQRSVTPPRCLEPGDIVIAFSDALGEWTAAQITDVDPNWKTVGVLELNWSGPEPATIDVIRGAKPLTLSHHAWNGRLSHCNYEWILPRSYRVLGSLPLLHDKRSNSYSSGWKLGDQLQRQRLWDRGERNWSDPRALKVTGDELDEALAGAKVTHPEIHRLEVTAIESVDGERLVEAFPNLTRLMMVGNLGQFTNAADLNRLTSLKALHIKDLFGMEASDCLLPSQVPGLEALGLQSIPQTYASAMRSRWRPEIPHGTSVEIVAARKPEWVRENRNNPLREWDGREHISNARYKKAHAQYKATRRAVLALLANELRGETLAQITELGNEFGRAFNKLDGRSPFIETEEREDLFAALETVIAEAEELANCDFAAERSALLDGAEAVRDW